MMQGSGIAIFFALTLLPVLVACSAVAGPEERGSEAPSISGRAMQAQVYSDMEADDP